MSKRKIVPQDEWFRAHGEHLKREKELTRLRDKIAAERRELPWLKIRKDYVFETERGPERLPDLFKGRLCNVAIETASELTMGMTVIDWWGVTDRPRNAMVMRDIDAEGFFTLLTERLGRL